MDGTAGIQDTTGYWRSQTSQQKVIIFSPSVTSPFHPTVCRHRCYGMNSVGRFLAECCKRQLDQDGFFVLYFCCIHLLIICFIFL